MHSPTRTAVLTTCALLIGFVATAAAASGVDTAGHSTRARALRIQLYGARISTGDYAFKVSSSLDGTGAAITHVTSSSSTFPITGKSVTKIYFADGVSKHRDSFKQDAPNAQGISKFTGSGRCAGGTGIHKSEKCHYAFTGTYDNNTNQNDLKITGTDTR